MGAGLIVSCARRGGFVVGVPLFSVQHRPVLRRGCILGVEESAMTVREQVEKILTEEIAPRLKADGGGIELVDVTEDNVVQVRLQGACAGCPGAQMTLRMGVERILKDAIPEVAGVEAV